jgi:hypothetical protein
VTQVEATAGFIEEAIEGLSTHRAKDAAAG